MKKTLTATITSALAIGVASVTFAAANPFSDVPTDHWSFDAVAKLAQEGVIEGYGDNTFRGDAHITRYEMAQMVAKAMAKEDVSGADKATIEKLAAEYADELNNLGVRVANLEKKSDNVTISGLMRINASNKQVDGLNDQNTKDAVARFNIKAKVNDEWNVLARLEGRTDLGDNKNGSFDLHRIYAEGPLLGANAKLGRFYGFDMAGMTNAGLMMDSKYTGAEFAFGNKVKTTLTYGRLAADNYDALDTRADLAVIQFRYDADKYKLGAAYYNVNDTDGMPFDGSSSAGIWEAGFDYSFTPDFTFGGMYAASDVDGDSVYGNNGSDQEKAYSVQMTYKGAQAKVPGSYGVWLGYRHLGELATFAPTFVAAGSNEKGIEVGVDYMLARNILAKVAYFDGEKIDTEADTSKIFGRLEFSF